MISMETRVVKLLLASQLHISSTHVTDAAFVVCVIFHCSRRPSCQPRICLDYLLLFSVFLFLTLFPFFGFSFFSPVRTMFDPICLH